MKPKPRVPEPSRAACQLALAHYVERKVQAGELPDYATVARALGITRARITQIMKLTLLSPKLQEGVLVGGTGVSERSLRHASVEPVWEDQRGLPHTSGPS